MWTDTICHLCNLPASSLFFLKYKSRTEENLKIILIILGSFRAGTHSVASLSDTMTWSKTGTEPTTFWL